MRPLPSVVYALRSPVAQSTDQAASAYVGCYSGLVAARSAAELLKRKHDFDSASLHFCVHAYELDLAAWPRRPQIVASGAAVFDAPKQSEAMLDRGNRDELATFEPLFRVSCEASDAGQKAGPGSLLILGFCSSEEKALMMAHTLGRFPEFKSRRASILVAKERLDESLRVERA